MQWLVQRKKFTPTLIVTLHGPREVSNHRQLNCLFNSLFRLTTKKTLNFRNTDPLWGEQPVTGGYPHTRLTTILLLVSCICDLSSAACSDGTLRVWDVAGIKEEKVIELVDEESGISSDMITITALVNDDKWVACLSIREIGLFDIETGLYIKTIYPEMDDGYDFMRCKLPSRTVRLWNFS